MTLPDPSGSPLSDEIDRKIAKAEKTVELCKRFLEAYKREDMKHDAHLYQEELEEDADWKDDQFTKVINKP